MGCVSGLSEFFFSKSAMELKLVYLNTVLPVTCARPRAQLTRKFIVVRQDLGSRIIWICLMIKPVCYFCFAPVPGDLQPNSWWQIGTPKCADICGDDLSSYHVFVDCLRLEFKRKMLRMSLGVSHDYFLMDAFNSPEKVDDLYCFCEFVWNLFVGIN